MPNAYGRKGQFKTFWACKRLLKILYSYTIKMLSNIPSHCKKPEKHTKKTHCFIILHFTFYQIGERRSCSGWCNGETIDSRLRFYQSPSCHNTWERVCPYVLSSIRSTWLLPSVKNKEKKRLWTQKLETLVSADKDSLLTLTVGVMV